MFNFFNNELIEWAMWLIFWVIFLLFHELGHAVMYRICTGDNNWKIDLGMGKPMFTVGKITVNSLFFFGGYCDCEKGVERKSHWLPISAGGILVNFSFVILCSLLLWQIGGIYEPSFYNIILPLINIAFFVNIGLFLFNAIPMVYPVGIRPGPNDGMSIVLFIYRHIRGRKGE